MDICAVVFPAGKAQFSARQNLVSCRGIQSSAIWGSDVWTAWIPAFPVTHPGTGRYGRPRNARASGMPLDSGEQAADARRGPRGETGSGSETWTDCAEPRTGEKN